MVLLHIPGSVAFGDSFALEDRCFVSYFLFLRDIFDSFFFFFSCR